MLWQITESILQTDTNTQIKIYVML